MTLAYYNEFDPFAAAWLRELIADGLIAPGLVDERSIEDVTPDDLRGFDQCHFFAGIGVWSLAARQAGWPDDRPLWTGSAPCPPFSSAGPDFQCPVCNTRRPVPNAVRTGVFNCISCRFEWEADRRHLWPEFYRLIRHYPDVPVVGEQVASGDGRVWVDLVRASLEMLGRPVGVVDTCAAGFGAPHIRQRLYWLANANGQDRRAGLRDGQSAEHGRSATSGGSDVRGLADAIGQGPQGRADLALPGARGRVEGNGAGRGGARLAASVGMADTDEGRRGRLAPGDWGVANGPPAGRIKSDGCAQPDSAVGGQRPGPTNGYWRDADWLSCTDGKWRPVESSPLIMADDGSVRDLLASGGRTSDTFPLAETGAFKNRVGELRGAGNAVTLAQAAWFLKAVMSLGA